MAGKSRGEVHRPNHWPVRATHASVSIYGKVAIARTHSRILFHLPPWHRKLSRIQSQGDTMRVGSDAQCTSAVQSTYTSSRRIQIDPGEQQIDDDARNRRSEEANLFGPTSRTMHEQHHMNRHWHRRIFIPHARSRMVAMISPTPSPVTDTSDTDTDSTRAPAPVAEVLGNCMRTFRLCASHLIQ